MSVGGILAVGCLNYVCVRACVYGRVRERETDRHQERDRETDRDPIAFLLHRRETLRNKATIPQLCDPCIDF